jgi:hypothetical protein
MGIAAGYKVSGSKMPALAERFNFIVVKTGTCSVYQASRKEPA